MRLKKKSSSIVSAPFIDLVQNGTKLTLTKLPASVLTNIAYASVRGRDHEEGAVQRVLGTSRIASVKEYTILGGGYPNCIILNWNSDINPLMKSPKVLKFRNITDSAQIIDGQHRLAGIKAAIEEKKAIGALELPVVIFQDLSTEECANIFLSINTEQKTVSRSLVFDLYDVASDWIVDMAAVRARDIAEALNTEEVSPYYGRIKFPGTERRGGIALSTIVTALKPLVEPKGAFEQVGILELEVQKKIIFNFLSALSGKYADFWEDRDNAFLYAAGFMGAMSFLKLKLIPYLNLGGSFKVSDFGSVLMITKDTLVRQQDVKQLSGSAAADRIYETLVNLFRPKAAKAKVVVA